MILTPYWRPLKQNYYSYYKYTLTTPISFGMWNVISLIIADYFGLISILSSISISILVTIYKLRDFKNINQNIKYYIIIFIRYMILWNIVIYNIEKNI